MMKKILDNIQQKLNELLQKNSLVMLIVKKIDEHGGRAFLVGGAVRDLFLGKHVKDLDIEVHGLKSDELENIISSFGPVSLVGKVFGVFRLHGLDIDWSLPRMDAAGRKPDVVIDPSMSIYEAFKRRDLTINAMGIDLITGELVDPFNGEQDLRNKILRAPDKNLFVQDPLRFYRVMQFIGRFEMFPDQELNDICKAMDIKKISKERIEEEFKKLFLKSEHPSLGIDWLNQIGRLSEVLPELYATIGVPQELKWHPEGDVYEHTKQVLDAAAILEYDSEDEKLILMWAALCHDLGKVSTTELVDGKYRSYEHENESEKLAKNLLKRITRNHDLIESVCKLARYHMHPGQFIKNKANPPAYKRLAIKLMPYTNLKMLTKLFLVDRLGRNPKKGKPLTGIPEDVEKFLKKVKDLNILTSIEEPVLQGRDFLDIVEAGPQLGKLVKIAYDIQIEDGIKDKDELKRRTLETLSFNSTPKD